MSAVRGRVALGVTVLAGAVLAVVGGLGLLAPDVLHEANGIPLTVDPGLRSEVRGGGATLLLVGAVVLWGARNPSTRALAATAGGAVLLAYAVGRAVSWVADGYPGSGLLLAGLVEVVLGVAALAVAGGAPAARLGADRTDRVSSPAR